jgi:molybdopterin converting factor small subunit
LVYFLSWTPALYGRSTHFCGLWGFPLNNQKNVFARVFIMLADALLALWTVYPGVRDRVATEQGQVREHTNIFVGNENVRYTSGLASPVSAGCEISIVPAVSGG